VVGDESLPEGAPRSLSVGEPLGRHDRCSG
jgi:hypothetical protein